MMPGCTYGHRAGVHPRRLEREHQAKTVFAVATTCNANTIIVNSYTGCKSCL